MSTITGSLTKGFSIEGIAHTEFELRDATVENILDAELEAGVHTPLNFKAQLLALQLVKVTSKDGKSTFDGPFTIGMIKKLAPKDFHALRAKQTEVEALGEAE